MSPSSDSLNRPGTACYCAQMADSLSRRYQDLLDGSYDCVDRIVLNAYFRPGHSAGGFRVWWRQLTGSDDTLDTAHLMRMAGRFSRRVRGYAKAHGIPVIDCGVGKRKHELAEDHLATTKVTKGVFLILVGRAQAPIWDVSGNHHLERKRPMPYVNHYSFHILDRDWGHLTIKISGHPPFPAQVILNGHEYVACRARKAGIRFIKEGNCFTHISDPVALATIADTLSDSRTVGRLRQLCDQWIYSACLCFALDLEEQRHSGFQYQYSNYQIEYSRNLVFAVGAQMDRVFQALIDRTRAPLDLKTIKTILGYRRRPRYRKRRHQAPVWEVTVETPVYDLTIFKLHCGRLTLKIYTKGERVLRIEAVAHNTEALHCGRSLERFPLIVHELQSLLGRFTDALSCVDQCFIAGDTLEQLPSPSRVGHTTVGGLDFNKARTRRVAQAILGCALAPGGFCASDIAHRVQQLAGPSAGAYGPRHAAYDLKKFRGKDLVRRIGRTRRYEPVPSGLRTLTALVILRDKVIQPLLAAAEDTAPSRGPHNASPLDRHYESLRVGMQAVFHELGLAA
jgi:hypothetical protein